MAARPTAWERSEYAIPGVPEEFEVTAGRGREREARRRMLRALIENPGEARGLERRIVERFLRFQGKRTGGAG